MLKKNLFEIIKKNPVYFISIIYFISISSFLIYHRTMLTVDLFIISGFILTFFLGKAKKFFKDWLPFVILLLSYEYLRGLVPFFTKKINITPMIDADRLIFGYIPTIKLQTLLFNPQKIGWYDYLTVIIYLTHFITPPLVGFLFWLKNRKIFKQYTVNLLILSYLGFITYLLYPAMPPWLASIKGYLPEVHKIIGYVFEHLGPTINLNSIYSNFNPNANAAMPSLHSAYPWLIFLFLFSKFRSFSYLFLIYTVLVWFSLVYLGEHYVIDVVVGVFYASITYLIFFKFSDLFTKNKTNNFNKEINLLEIIDQQPINYYEKGIKTNLGQRLWHTHKMKIIAQILNDLKKNLKFNKILDLGCSDGYLTNWLSKQVNTKNIFGMDISKKLIKAAKSKYPNLYFFYGDAHKIPFKQNYIDLVLCIEVLEHVNDPNFVIKEIYRILKKGKYLIIELDTGNWLFSILWFMWTKFGKGKIWQNAHISQFNKKSLSQIIQKNHFNIKTVKTHHLGMAVTIVAQK